MKKSLNFVLCGLLLTLISIPKSYASTLPLNNLSREDNPRVLYNISPELFKKLINQVVTIYSPVVRAHSAELKANLNWDDSTVNAFADRDGSTWSLNFFGGLARRKEVTPDAFTLVICHELGHHLGGYPFVIPLNAPSDFSWAASEGEADYFATQVCARKVWSHEADENARHRATVDPTAREHCDRAWPTQVQRDLCYRSSDAGQSLASLLNYLMQTKRPVRYSDTRNDQPVPVTFTEHPAAQCRLETYLNGAICPRTPDVGTIPGIDIQLAGGSLLDEEKEAAKSSCASRGAVYDGSRPRCWFKPLLSNW